MKKVLNIIIIFFITLTVCLPMKIFAADMNKGKDKKRKELINILETYILKNESFLKTINKESNQEQGVDYHKLRQELEKYQEFFFIPALGKIVKLICDDKDEFLLFLFLKTLIVTRNSGDETRYYALSEIYLCNPVLVVQMFKNLETKNKKIIYEDLKFALSLLSHNKDISKEKYKNLKHMLDNLEKEIRCKSGARLGTPFSSDS